MTDLPTLVVNSSPREWMPNELWAEPLLQTVRIDAMPLVTEKLLDVATWHRPLRAGDRVALAEAPNPPHWNEPVPFATATVDRTEKHYDADEWLVTVTNVEALT